MPGIDVFKMIKIEVFFLLDHCVAWKGANYELFIVLISFS
jgi:hypothetical protein